MAATGPVPSGKTIVMTAMKPGNLLSGDFPRSAALAIILVAIVAGLALAPFVFPGTRSLDVAAKVCVFILLVASYDLLLGYTGIVSFAHTMFFGIGGYGVAIAMSRLDPEWSSIAAGTLCAVLASLLLSFLVGLFSLRVKAIFFAMITLAVAAFFAILASQLSAFTGGEDGISFKVPEIMRPGFRLLEEPVMGVVIGGRLVTYYFIFFGAVILFLLLLRVVNSPFGRVLLAIRENDFRAEALGYRTVIYRTIANCLGAAAATLAGVFYALWLRYTGPNTTLDFSIMVDILLMVVIGGMGTMYGAVLGATLFVIAQNYLQDAMKAISDASQGLPLLPSLFHPDRWLLWLGVLFVLSVYYFPYGIVGKLRMMAWTSDRNKALRRSKT
jgi:branched-chain amino acid transport system permease protein